MSKEQKIAIHKSHIIFSLGIVFLIWFIYWLEIYFSKNFNDFGIYPRTLRGLKGIFLSPFIHSSTSHLFNNSIPFLVLVNLLFVFYKEASFKILFFGTVLSGFITWIIARDAYHIGLSGVIYLLFSFIFFSGVVRKNFRLIATSLVVIFLYGSMIWYVFPVKNEISWEGHLSGFLVGLFLAFFYRHKGIQKEHTEFQETDFDLLFDEEGNFIGDEERGKVNPNADE